MNEYYADLHIHLGRTATGRPVKISGSKDLTFARIAEVSSQEKGIAMVGIIDCHVPEIQEEIKGLLAAGIMKERTDGGISYEETTIILGSEIEIMDEGYRPVHYLCYLPTLEHMSAFSRWLGTGMKNLSLSSQRLYRSTRELQEKVKELEGLFVPAHIFTPFKGIYGSAVERMEMICNMDQIDAVELGLSGDTHMADSIAELASYTFLTNSDAHSLGKIGREYQKIRMAEPSFMELRDVLRRKNGRRVTANYGLSPQLGKYHISFCLECESPLERYQPDCPNCGGIVLKGVAHRIEELSSRKEPQHPEHRPPYIHQIPLEFFPGIGKKTYTRLLALYGTEMNILHHVPIEQIRIDFGDSLAQLLDKSRKGLLKQEKGGGGNYGRVLKFFY